MSYSRGTSSALSYPTLTSPSSSENVTVLQTSDDDSSNELRLWIGNLDPKLTEFHLLKFVQQFGLIKDFDFLFHRSGPNAGLPRGYAFVTYKNSEDANKCLKRLNGKKILEKIVAVRWAHQEVASYPDDDEKIKNKLPALGMKTVVETPQSKERAICAIEAKLRSMERDVEGATFNLAGPGLNKKGNATLSRNSAFNKDSSNTTTNNVRRGQSSYRYHHRHSYSDKYSKPYGRNTSRR